MIGAYVFSISLLPSQQVKVNVIFWCKAHPIVKHFDGFVSLSLSLLWKLISNEDTHGILLNYLDSSSIFVYPQYCGLPSLSMKWKKWMHHRNWNLQSWMHIKFENKKNSQWSLSLNLYFSKKKVQKCGLDASCSRVD